MKDNIEEELNELPPFYNSIEPYEEYKMTDKRKYTEVIRDLDAKMAEYNITIEYVKNHLSNIDSHMAKINDTNLKQEVKIARNKDRIGLGYKIGGVLLALLGGSLVFILHLLGIY